MSEDIQLFAPQKIVYPRDVKGRYRQLKWLAMAALLGIYYLAPWIRWDRGPHAPDQAILIDMPARRAYFFFIEIWPQEVFYLTGILILAAIGLFFATSLFGRVWCGYACPQTVWTDLYIKVESLVQGDRNARMKRDQGPWNFDKIWRKGITHLIWILVALCTGGAWVFYFSDAPTLLDQILHLQIPRSTTIWIFGLTASTYFMAGFAREQVCGFVCPYARFQSGMFDQDTLIIGYDAQRGEPRAPHKQGDSWDGRGHCIDCGLCVAVCPAGIDIRNGLQLQCISCGLCVDACNNVMDKVGLPRGLVRYDTERNQKDRLAAQNQCLPHKDRLRIFRPRSIYYIVVLLVVSAVMTTAMVLRSPYDVHVLHERNPLFVRLSSGAYRNTYTLKILNKAHEDHAYVLTTEGLPDAALKLEAAGAPDPQNLLVEADSVGHFRVLLTLPPGAPPFTRHDVVFHVVDKATNKSQNVASVFMTKE